MSANEEDELCNLFENLMDRRKIKTDFQRLCLSQALEDEDSDDEEKTLPTPIHEIISGMYSYDLTYILKATKSLRKMFAKQIRPPIEQIIEAGLVKLLVTFLGCDCEPFLQYEAAWAFINITSGSTEDTFAVVQAGAVPHLIRLLASPHGGIVYDCAWVLGNIIGDGAEFRDFVIENGIFTPLMRLVDMNAPPKFMRTVTWVILNLCRNNNPPPKVETVNACLSALRILIQHTDCDVLAHTCWALHYVIVDTHDFIQQVVASPGVVSGLVKLLGIPETRVILPALKTIGTITSGDDSQTQAVIDYNVLQMLPVLLQHPNVNIKELAGCVLSNIIGGSSEQIQAVIDCNLLPLIIDILITGDFKSQREATWMITNLAGRGTLEQINYVVQCGALNILCDLLITDSPKLLNDVLDAICSVLEATNKFGQLEPLYAMLKEIGGLDKIEKLQHSNNIQVWYKSCKIIHKFF